MDKLLILAESELNALEAANLVGLNSNQFYAITSLDQLKSINLDEGIYAFTDKPPVQGLEMKYELQTMPFFSVPNVGYLLKDYIKTIINEINTILGMYNYSYMDDQVRSNLERKIRNMFDSCKMTQNNGFLYDVYVLNRGLKIEPRSDKMRVIKDLINSISLINY